MKYSYSVYYSSYIINSDNPHKNAEKNLTII